MQDFRRILVVRTDRIGDVILTLPMLEVLRRCYPHAHIAMLVRHYTRGLLEGNLHIDEVLLYDDGVSLVPLGDMAGTIRERNFDVAFLTYPRFRLAWLIRRAGVPLRIGTGYRWYSFLFNKQVYVHRKIAERHEAEYNIDLVKAVGCEVTDIPFPRLTVSQRTADDVKRLLPRLSVSTNGRLVILHPGSGGSARDWSAKNFGLLGRRLAQLPDVHVVVTGGAGEESLAKQIASTIGSDTPVVVNSLSLQQYAAFAAQASLLVANSTGPLHIAAAVGTPVVGLYPQVTAMNPSRWGPYTANKRILVPHGKPEDCRQCLTGEGTDCECMDSITVDEVFAAAQSFLRVEHLSESKQY